MYEPTQQTNPQTYSAMPQVVESASATTSPDNANSGNKAYLIFGVALLVLTLILAGLFGLFSRMFEQLASEIEASGNDHPISYDLTDDNTNYQSIIDNLEGTQVQG